jgi:uncharacterized protein (AIM24 family)
MEATVRDGQAPAVVVALQPGERLTSEAGAMMFVSGDISIDVEMPGGLAGGLKRKLFAGESLFLTRYQANAAGAVGITGPFPGSVRQHELDGEIICEKHAYLGHYGEVEIERRACPKAGHGRGWRRSLSAELATDGADGQDDDDAYDSSQPPAMPT